MDKTKREIVKVDNSLDRITDMPKLHSPFVREDNDKGEYVVTPKVEEGFEWVLEDDSVEAVEKLHGTNVSVVIENGYITSVFNRTGRVPAYNKSKQYITKAVLNSMKRKYTDLRDGQWFGEVVGPKLQGNPYQLDKHLWIPFKKYSQEKLVYKSWGDYPKTFESISQWFKDGLIPLFYCREHGVSFQEAEEADAYCEGIVFTHPDGRMAKLRRDMFDWFKGRRH